MIGRETGHPGRNTRREDRVGRGSERWAGPRGGGLDHRERTGGRRPDLRAGRNGCRHDASKKGDQEEDDNEESNR